VPYLYHLIVEMEDRFFDQKQKCRSCWGLIPKYCDASPNTAQDLERLHQEDIGPKAAVVPEVQRWVNKWKKEDVSTVPSSAIEALCACHADIYPECLHIANHFKHSSCINCYKRAQLQHHETS